MHFLSSLLWQQHNVFCCILCVILRSQKSLKTHFTSVEFYTKRLYFCLILECRNHSVESAKNGDRFNFAPFSKVSGTLDTDSNFLLDPFTKFDRCVVRLELDKCASG